MRFRVPGWGWVSTLGPYNEHLVRDYGAVNLALGVLLVSAALFLERRLVQVALLTYLAFATPHFLFHAVQVHYFSAFHNAIQLGTLGFRALWCPRGSALSPPPRWLHRSPRTVGQGSQLLEYLGRLFPPKLRLSTARVTPWDSSAGLPTRRTGSVK